ncbi:MAG TPA: sugar phosphate isomerase/epimerase, partial [Armatimonadetes bacterium]|nr:sugar phosphate isomerase/epimerase [Armatimonadota bacterium]
MSLCTIAFNELPLMNVLDIAVEFGFDGVELWGKAPHMPHDSKPHYVEAVRMALDERSLELAAYGSYLTAGTDEFDAQMPLVLNIARWLGAQRVRVWAGNIGSADADESYRKHCVRDFQRLCDVGGEYGITFAIERHSHTLTDEFESALNLLEQINRENIGINYQRGHGATTEAVVHEIEAFGRRIINVHCHNVRRTESGEVAWDLHSGEID